MSKFSIINLIFSILVFVRQLVNFSFRDQPYPTPSSNIEALYNMFIRDNSVFPVTFCYVIISFGLFFYIKRKRNLKVY